MRGIAVAGSSVALAIGAHGIAGGGAPHGLTLMLLAGVATVLAACVVAVPALAVRRMWLVPVVAAGQVLSHLALSLGDAHAGIHTGSHLTGPMLLAHSAAVVLCAALIAGAERIGPRAYAALRRILPRILAALPVRLEPDAPHVVADVRPLLSVVHAGPIARRGPPAFR
ncbi:MFS transporter [Prescottella defluvii]